jgi:hypothetical protein
MPQIVHTHTACVGHPFVASSDIVALQAASLVDVSVLCSMHAAVIVVVHAFGFSHASRVETLLRITRNSLGITPRNSLGRVITTKCARATAPPLAVL